MFIQFRAPQPRSSSSAHVAAIAYTDFLAAAMFVPDLRFSPRGNSGRFPVNPVPGTPPPNASPSQVSLMCSSATAQEHGGHDITSRRRSGSHRAWAPCGGAGPCGGCAACTRPQWGVNASPSPGWGVRRPFSGEQAVRTAFQIFDVDRDGRLTRDELVQARAGPLGRVFIYGCVTPHGCHNLLLRGVGRVRAGPHRGGAVQNRPESDCGITQP